MELSIIIIHQGSKSDLQKSLYCLQFQTNKNFEIVIIDGSGENNRDIVSSNLECIYVNDEFTGSFYQLANKGIKKCNGSHCLFLSAGEELSNDYVVEELYQNRLDKDIIFCNLKSIDNFENEELFLYDSITASSLILETISLKSAVIKRNLLLDSNLFKEELSEMASWHFFVHSILANSKTFKHINMFLSICNMNNGLNNVKLFTGFEDRVKILLPEILPLYAQNFVDYNHILNVIKTDDYQALLKLSHTRLFKVFSKIRKFCLERGIYYPQKAYFRKKMLYRRIRKEDNKQREIVDELIQKLPHNLLQTCTNAEDDVIVSLTSYGHRVSDSVPYTIYSLFTQKVLPNRIMLYLAENEWNEDTIPDNLKRLKLSGLEICYCEDLRSYKKLIPAMMAFPNNPIITFDDDVYYNDATIKELLIEYEKSDKKTVICHRGAIVERRFGEFTPYNKWRDYMFGNKYSMYSPIGVDGVLYPAKTFDKEILNKDAFMKYAPFADDLWFWLNSYKLGIRVINVENTTSKKNRNVNTMEQLIEKKSTALHFRNFVNGANNTQFSDLLNYFGLK